MDTAAVHPRSQACYHFFNAQNARRAAITAVALVGIGLLSYGIAAGISTAWLCGWAAACVLILCIALKVKTSNPSEQVKGEQIKIKVATWDLRRPEPGEPPEKRQALIKEAFSSLASLDIDIFCVQGGDDLTDLLSFLPEYTSMMPGIIWKNMRFTSGTTCILSSYPNSTPYVQLKENQTGQVFDVVSVKIAEFDLKKIKYRSSINEGNDQLFDIVSQFPKTSNPIFISGNFHAPCLRVECYDEYIQIFDDEHREWHYTRHQIIDDRGFTTLPPTYPTNQSIYGPIPGTYIYVRGSSSIEPIGLPDALANCWKQSVSFNKPVIQEIALGLTTVC